MTFWLGCTFFLITTLVDFDSILFLDPFSFTLCRCYSVREINHNRHIICKKYG